MYRGRLVRSLYSGHHARSNADGTFALHPMDLSQYHSPLTTLFTSSDPQELTNGQIEFYKTNGYLAGIRILNDEQVDILTAELNQLMDPAHPDHHLFYEFHTNE